MIVKHKKLGFLRLLIEMRGSIVPAIAIHILASALLGVFACLLIKQRYLNAAAADALKLSPSPFTALGVAISLFLGFHNNASYNRWWEARILWGRQIIVTRDISRMLMATLNDDDDEIKIEGMDSEEDGWKGIIQSMNEISQDVESNYTSTNTITVNGWRENIVRLACAHTHAFRYQMRPSCEMDGNTTALNDRDRFLTRREQNELMTSRNPANRILFMASKILGSAHRRNLIDTYPMIHVQKSIDTLCEIQTACERIQNTSIPLAYSLLVHRTSFLYVLLVPFAIVDAVG